MSLLACLHLTIHAHTQLYNLLLVNYQFPHFSVCFTFLQTQIFSSPQHVRYPEDC